MDKCGLPFSLQTKTWLKMKRALINSMPSCNVFITSQREASLTSR